LTEVGGTPQGWKLFPHRKVDGKALHIVQAESPKGILSHLDHISDIYEREEIIKIQNPDR
jgi:hypothetical protein